MARRRRNAPAWIAFAAVALAIPMVIDEVPAPWASSWAATRTPPQVAEATLRPFGSESIWRLPIAHSATFAPPDDARNIAIHDTGADGDGSVWTNSDSYSHPVAYARPTDPLATVTDVAHGGRWQDVIPANAKIASGTDADMHVISPDGHVAHEYFGVTRVSATAYTVRRRAEVSLTGSGIGPQQGVRAYGGSAVGGLVRGWEVDPSDPRHTGVITHPLAVALRSSQMHMGTADWSGEYGYYDSGLLDPATHPGWPAGTPAVGFMKQPGYVWPATEQDYGSPSNYTGPIPMGSYFAIPPWVDITRLGLRTPEGLMVARAAQDYGIYVTDTSGAMSFYCEDDDGPARAFAYALNDADRHTAHDPRVVLDALSVVTDNGPTTPNGGDLGAARR